MDMKAHPDEASYIAFAQTVQTEELEESGKAYKMDKKGVMQMTAKYKQVLSCLSLIQCVYDGVEAIFAQKDAE